MPGWPSVFKLLETLHDTSLDALADALPWRMVIEDGVIMTNLGGYLGTFEWVGPNLEDVTTADYLTVAQRLNDELVRLGSGWTLVPEVRRVKSRRYHDPRPTAPPLVQMLDEERRQYHQRSGVHYASKVRYSFAYHEPRGIQDKSERYFFEQAGIAPPLAGASRALQTFKAGMAQIASAFAADKQSHVRLRRLGLRAARTATGEVIVYDDLLSYLYSMLRGVEQPIIAPPPGMTIGKLFSAHEAIMDRQPSIDDDALAIIRVTIPPKNSEIGMLNALFTIPVECSIVIRTVLYGREQSERRTTRGRDEARQNLTGFLDGLTRSFGKPSPPSAHKLGVVTEAERSIDRVQRGDYLAANVTVTVAFYGSDRTTLGERVKAALDALKDSGFVAAPAVADAGRVFFGRLPGDIYSDVDGHAWTTANVVHVTPIATVWPGVQAHPCEYYRPDAPTHIIASGAGGETVHLPLHWGRAANTLLVGGARTGKTVLTKRMLWSHLLLEDSAFMAFDRDESMFVMASVLEDLGVGAYTRLDDERVAFCPFEFLHESVKEREWALATVESWCMHRGVTITNERRDKILTALELLANGPDRRVSDLRQRIPDRDVRAVLDYYSDRRTIVGRLLNGPANGLSGRRAQFVDMTHLLPLSDADRLPIYRQLVHLADRRTIRRRPFALLYDEARPLLRDEPMAQLITESLQRWPKRNAFSIVATQGMNDILSAGERGLVVLQECKTRLFAGDSTATDPVQRQELERAGISHRHIDRIAANAQSRRYLYTSPLGTSSFDLGLQECERAVITCDEGDDLRHVKELMQTHPTTWFQRHLIERGLSDWAAYYDELRSQFRHRDIQEVA